MSQANENQAVIVAAKRSAIGKFSGGLSSLKASDIGAQVIAAVLKETGVDAAEISDVILGQVLTAIQGQNPARQAAIASGIAQSSTAMTINQVCGSGLRSVALAAQAIACGDADIVICGGQENMSASPHAQMMRAGYKMGDFNLQDTMIIDGLWDSFNDYHMGITAENIAAQYNISRQAQDEFALQSQQRAQAAIDAGKFKDEIVPITYKNRKQDVVIDKDEFPRAGVTLDDLSALRPAFKPDGSVTAGNASGINDGAAILMVMSAAKAQEKGLTPLAKIASWATAGVDPSIMGTGPIPASQKALEKAGWQVGDLDLIESNEAFAAQAICVINALGLPGDKVNVNGGAIALGHPIGASGARVLVSLLHEMRRIDAQKGLATLCIGGGMGIALCVSRDGL